MIIYFSGTGNSRYVAEALADHLSDETVSSNEYIKEGRKGAFTGGKPWVFVFPIYISSMAEIFADFLRGASFDGNKNAYFIATCASANGVSPNIGRKICDAKGLTYMGTEKVVMPQNYIALFSMTEPDEITKRQNDALVTVDRIAGTIKAGGQLDMKIRSAAECAITLWVERLYNRYFTGTKNFYATEECVSCGLCAKVCPLNNIAIIDGRPRWSDTCIHCMSCINRCPKTAIEYGKHTAAKTRYVCRKYDTE